MVHDSNVCTARKYHLQNEIYGGYVPFNESENPTQKKVCTWVLWDTSANASVIIQASNDTQLIQKHIEAIEVFPELTCAFANFFNNNNNSIEPCICYQVKLFEKQQTFLFYADSYTLRRYHNVLPHWHQFKESKMQNEIATYIGKELVLTHTNDVFARLRTTLMHSFEQTNGYVFRNVVYYFGYIFFQDTDYEFGQFAISDTGDVRFTKCNGFGLFGSLYKDYYFPSFYTWKLMKKIKSTRDFCADHHGHFAASSVMTGLYKFDSSAPSCLLGDKFKTKINSFCLLYTIQQIASCRNPVIGENLYIPEIDKCVCNYTKQKLFMNAEILPLIAQKSGNNNNNNGSTTNNSNLLPVVAIPDELTIEIAATHSIRKRFLLDYEKIQDGLHSIKTLLSDSPNITKNEKQEVAMYVHLLSSKFKKVEFVKLVKPSTALDLRNNFAIPYRLHEDFVKHEVSIPTWNTNLDLLSHVDYSSLEAFVSFVSNTLFQNNSDFDANLDSTNSLSSITQNQNAIFAQHSKLFEIIQTHIFNTKKMLKSQQQQQRNFLNQNKDNYDILNNAFFVALKRFENLFGNISEVEKSYHHVNNFDQLQQMKDNDDNLAQSRQHIQLLHERKFNMVMDELEFLIHSAEGLAHPPLVLESDDDKENENDVIMKKHDINEEQTLTTQTHNEEKTIDGLSLSDEIDNQPTFLSEFETFDKRLELHLQNISSFLRENGVGDDIIKNNMPMFSFLYCLIMKGSNQKEGFEPITITKISNNEIPNLFDIPRNVRKLSTTKMQLNATNLHSVDNQCFSHFMQPWPKYLLSENLKEARKQQLIEKEINVIYKGPTTSEHYKLTWLLKSWETILKIVNPKAELDFKTTTTQNSLRDGYIHWNVVFNTAMEPFDHENVKHLSHLDSNFNLEKLSKDAKQILQQRLQKCCNIDQLFKMQSTGIRLLGKPTQDTNQTYNADVFTQAKVGQLLGIIYKPFVNLVVDIADAIPTTTTTETTTNTEI